MEWYPASGEELGIADEARGRRAGRQANPSSQRVDEWCPSVVAERELGSEHERIHLGVHAANVMKFISGAFCSQAEPVVDVASDGALTAGKEVEAFTGLERLRSGVGVEPDIRKPQKQLAGRSVLAAHGCRRIFVALGGGCWRRLGGGRRGGCACSTIGIRVFFGRGFGRVPGK